MKEGLFVWAVGLGFVSAFLLIISYYHWNKPTPKDPCGDWDRSCGIFFPFVFAVVSFLGAIGFLAAYVDS